MTIDEMPAGPATPLWEREDVYEAAQDYRWAPLADQAEVVRRYKILLALVERIVREQM